jgi:hypothetical protein
MLQEENSVQITNAYVYKSYIDMLLVINQNHVPITTVGCNLAVGKKSECLLALARFFLSFGEQFRCSTTLRYFHTSQNLVGDFFLMFCISSCTKFCSTSKLHEYASLRHAFAHIFYWIFLRVLVVCFAE